MPVKSIYNIKETITNEYFPIIVLLCINIIIGWHVYTDYGESWDEHLRYQYAENSINAYKGMAGNKEDEKGPLFVMIATIGGKFICYLQRDCLIGDARHYINFLSFLLGLFFLYRLNNRFVDKWAALGGTLLFNTQPLLWGHAFINPKDLPFMAFFIASIDTGFAMAESFRHTDSLRIKDVSNRFSTAFVSQVISEWDSIIIRKKYIFISTCFIVITTIAGFLFFQDSIQQYIQKSVRDIYFNDTNNYLDRIFTLTAQNIDDYPVEGYVNKALQIYSRGIMVLSIFLVILWIIISAMIFSETKIYLWDYLIKPFAKFFWENLKNPGVILAGVFLGLTSSIRTLGPAAGGLVSLYLILIYKKNSIPTLIAYFTIGAIILYITWPGLWNDPIQNYLTSLQTASDFPWDGKVLFEGQYYLPGSTPRIYLPILILIQFTLTGILTIFIGTCLSFIKLAERKPEWKKLAIIYLWFLVPLIAVISLQPDIYDNFRHFLFIIPPLFILASIGIQMTFDLIKRPAIHVILLSLLIMPNFYPLIQLHPYQYVYYNLFVGGLKGAFREFEMDYWGTSYREATEYLNLIAPINSTIIVYGAPHLVEPYAREDLNIEKFKTDMLINRDSPSFALLSTRYDKDIYLNPQSEIIHRVEKDGAIFSVIKELDFTHP